MRILIAGAGGQVGRELVATAPATVVVVALERSALDITQPAAVMERVQSLQADVVINVAAYTAVDAAEGDPVSAYAANAEGAANLAGAAAACSARLIHLSTDFVFDGKQSRPYRPEDVPAPLNVYGTSKLEGERRVLALCGHRGLIIRTAWVYSAHGRNFVKTVLRLLQEREELGVIFDQVGTPTWARTLAHCVWAAVAKPALAGVYHWTDAGVASWYDFAVAIQEEATTLGLLTRQAVVRPILAEEYPLPARRPAYSVLDITRSLRDFAPAPVHWRQALRAMLAERARA